MMTRPIALTLTFLLAGCTSTPPSTSALSDADVLAIRATEAAWTELVTAGKFAELVERCYTKDAVLFPPNEPAAKGRAAIEACFRAWPAMTDITTRCDEVVGRGDMAYSTGAWSATVRQKGVAPISDKGKFVEIWRKDGDGVWRMSRDAFSSDLPATNH